MLEQLQKIWVEQKACLTIGGRVFREMLQDDIWHVGRRDISASIRERGTDSVARYTKIEAGYLAKFLSDVNDMKDAEVEYYS